MWMTISYPFLFSVPPETRIADQRSLLSVQSNTDQLEVAKAPQVAEESLKEDIQDPVQGSRCAGTAGMLNFLKGVSRYKLSSIK